MVPFADQLVDWAALGKVVVAALVAGIGVTAAFSLVVLGATRAAEMRRSNRAVEASAFAALGVAAAVFCVGAIVLGVIVMSEK